VCREVRRSTSSWNRWRALRMLAALLSFDGQ